MRCLPAPKGPGSCHIQEGEFYVRSFQKDNEHWGRQDRRMNSVREAEQGFQEKVAFEPGHEWYEGHNRPRTHLSSAPEMQGDMVTWRRQKPCCWKEEAEGVGKASAGQGRAGSGGLYSAIYISSYKQQVTNSGFYERE